VQNQPTDEVETLYGDAPEVDRVATTEPLPFTLGMALFKNLFIDACLKGSACWAQASSASPLLHATNVCDQPHPTIRAIDARLNGCVDQLSFRRTCQREFRDLKTRTRELCEQRGAVNEVERRRRTFSNVRRLVKVAHPLASA
jgi:hypothetical protein